MNNNTNYNNGSSQNIYPVLPSAPYSQTNYVPPYIPTQPIQNLMHYQNVSCQYVPEIEHNQMARLKEICQTHEIHNKNVQALHQLEGFEIVCIIDDSGSMNNGTTDLTDSQIDDPFVKGKTRWNELQSKIGIVVDIASCFDPDGIDIYFLNKDFR